MSGPFAISLCPSQYLDEAVVFFLEGDPFIYQFEYLLGLFSQAVFKYV